MTIVGVVVVLAVPIGLAITVGSVLLRRAFARPTRLPEEFAFAVAWVFVVGGLVWLGAALSGSRLLGYGPPWTWLAAAHFTFAGYGALTVTAICCRVVSGDRSLKVLRVLLLVHPLAYLVTAGGIMGFRYCDEIGAVSYELLFLIQLLAVVLGQPHRLDRRPRSLFVCALTVPVATLVPAVAWAFGRPIFHMDEMVRYHGVVNAIGHVGLAFGAFVWGRPPVHSIDLETGDANP